MNIVFSVITQAVTFLPLAFAISISYNVLRATDMTLEGSFVLGAALFARLVTLHMTPSVAAFIAMGGGACAGILVSLIQRGGKVDPLLAGILATFILASGNLALMGRPNINLLNEATLVSFAFAESEMMGWLWVTFLAFSAAGMAALLIHSRFGLHLRGLGDNPLLLKRMGKNVEGYRMLGFAFTNTLAAIGGILTAQTVGYADINMGFGMTLTGIGTIIIGQQLLNLLKLKNPPRVFIEILACLVGVVVYFFSMNSLLRLNINPIYLKMFLGLMLIVFLRAAMNRKVST